MLSVLFPCIRVGIGVQQGSLYLEQILRAYREAAQTEVQVLRYILDNHEQSMNMAVRDVANLNYTSAATVIKLS